MTEKIRKLVLAGQMICLGIFTGVAILLWAIVIWSYYFGGQ